MNNPNLESSSNGNSPQHRISAGADREVQEDSISSRISRVINIIQDVQSYTPHYLAEGLERVLELLFMIYPVSPPPVKYEERFGARSVPERRRFKTGQPKSGMLTRMLTVLNPNYNVARNLNTNCKILVPEKWNKQWRHEWPKRCTRRQFFCNGKFIRYQCLRHFWLELSDFSCGGKNKPKVHDLYGQTF